MKEQGVRNVKEEFLSAAFGYLVEHGLENASLRELCKATGISSGSLYYWFDGKDDAFMSTVEYGLNKVVNNIFVFAFKYINNLRKFFDLTLKEIAKYKSELRLIYQMVTSPIYGPKMRCKSENLKLMYERYTMKLSEKANISFDELLPIVYMYVSIILDYIVWDDYDNTMMQLDYLYKILSERLEYTERNIS